MFSAEEMFRWQGLIGSALGPFLAVVLSSLGYLAKSAYDRNREIKETHRRIEISLTKSLHDIYLVRAHILWIADRVSRLGNEALKLEEPNAIFLNRINFSRIREVFYDAGLVHLKCRSYYVHNKLLAIDAMIRQINESTGEFRGDYEEIVRLNSSMVTIGSDAAALRAASSAYGRNLNALAEVLRNFAKKFLTDSVKPIVQLKVYNNQLRGEKGYWALWKYEGISFKFFLTKSELQAYAKNLDSLSRIESLIEAIVSKTIESAEKRAKLMRQE